MFRMNRTTIALVAALAAMTFTTSVSAQSVCGKRADIIKRLNSDTYKEFQSSAGIAANGNLVEILHAKKGNFTIIFTKPGGATCLMVVGEYYEVIAEPFLMSDASAPL